MKITLTSLKAAGVVLAVAGMALSAPAIPTSISGDISMSGTVTIDGTGFNTATKFTAFQNVFVGGPAALSGDYAGTSGAAVTMTPYTWSPPTASTPISPLWSFTSAGKTYSFDLSVLHMDFSSPTGLLLSGLGTAHITGSGVEKLDTTGRWNLSAQTLGTATFTYSSSTSVSAGVPDGGSTVAMMGAALLGLGLLRRYLAV